jgi:hypothetical protein
VRLVVSKTSIDDELSGVLPYGLLDIVNSGMPVIVKGVIVDSLLLMFRL